MSDKVITFQRTDINFLNSSDYRWVGKQFLDPKSQHQDIQREDDSDGDDEDDEDGNDDEGAHDQSRHDAKINRKKKQHCSRRTRPWRQTLKNPSKSSSKEEEIVFFQRLGHQRRREPKTASTVAVWS